MGAIHDMGFDNYFRHVLRCEYLFKRRILHTKTWQKLEHGFLCEVRRTGFDQIIHAVPYTVQRSVLMIIRLSIASGAVNVVTNSVVFAIPFPII
jgi:hypothetical protein